MAEKTKNDCSPTRKALSGIALLLLLVGIALIVARIGSRNAGNGNGADQPEKADGGASRSMVKEGELYAGIAGRIEIPVDASTDTTAFPAAMDNAWATLVDVGGVFNAYDPASEVGRLNSVTEPGSTEISNVMGRVIGAAIAVGQITSGAFDITIRPLKTVWKKASETGIVPDDAAISAALGRVGWRNMNMAAGEGGKYILTRSQPGMELDFGGIVKGWSVGAAMDRLNAAGVKSALVQVGGEIALSGTAPTQNPAEPKPWRIGIRHPLEKDRNWTVLAISGRAAISTSGNYEQPVRIGSTDYYHIIDPSTGKPVSTDILGVTVVVTKGPDMNAMADGLSTAFAVLGADRALGLAGNLPGVEALFIVRNPATGQPEEKTTKGFNNLRAE